MFEKLATPRPALKVTLKSNWLVPQQQQQQQLICSARKRPPNGKAEQGHETI